MKLLTKLTTLARVLVSGHSKTPANTPIWPEQPATSSQLVQEQGTQMPSEALEQTRVADLLREQLGANKEKGE